MREPFHRLFFAVRPPAGAVAEIARWRDALGKTRNRVADERLHLTIWLFPDSADFAADAVARATRAMGAVPRGTFGIVLDRMVSGPDHVVLVPSEPLPGFTAFQARLDLALRGVGLVPRDGWRFSPHLTLSHGHHTVDRSIDPVGWTATEVLLLDSVVGERRHDVVARWPSAG